MLEKFEDTDRYVVSLKFVNSLLHEVVNDGDDWDSKSFEGFINSILAENPLAQARLIVRRNRDVAKGTGTLLSENDRKLGDTFSEITVLTMYAIRRSQNLSDGSHLIAIPYVTNPRRRRPKPPEEQITVVDENADNETIDGLSEANEPANDISEKGETYVAESVESGGEVKNKTEQKLTRKELFEELYNETRDKKRSERKRIRFANKRA